MLEMANVACKMMFGLKIQASQKDVRHENGCA
jgi:hypothetical protein